MRMPLQKVWESRAPRERRALTLLAVILSVTLYFWLITSADQARARLRSSLPALRVEAVELEQQASEYERIKNISSTSSSPGELRALVQSQVDAAGLSHTSLTLNSIEAANNQVQVVFNAVPFANWLDWAAGMQLQHVHLETGRIEALSEPGRVKVTATFIRVLQRDAR